MLAGITNMTLLPHNKCDGHSCIWAAPRIDGSWGSMGQMGFSACWGCPSHLSLSSTRRRRSLLTTSCLSHSGKDVSSYRVSGTVNCKTRSFPAPSSSSPAPCASSMLSITCPPHSAPSHQTSFLFLTVCLPVITTGMGHQGRNGEIR